MPAYRLWPEELADGVSGLGVGIGLRRAAPEVGNHQRTIQQEFQFGLVLIIETSKKPNANSHFSYPEPGEGWRWIRLATVIGSWYWNPRPAPELLRLLADMLG